MNLYQLMIDILLQYFEIETSWIFLTEYKICGL